MKNILVATDFSNNAYCALFYATQLLKSKPCNFFLLNTYNELTPLSGKSPHLIASKNLMQQSQTESEEGLTRTFHKISLDNDNSKHNFAKISQKGDLPEVITKLIKNKDIDLVVMGNKGFTETADIFFGSNTAQVVNSITICPVLAIPGELDYALLKDIAFVTDYKNGCNSETLAPLLFMASLSKAAIRVMHINEGRPLNKVQETNRGHLAECLKTIDHSFLQISDLGDKAKAIDSFLEKSKAQLFAMVHNKRSLFERLVREPVIKDVSMYSDVPFLVLAKRS